MTRSVAFSKSNRRIDELPARAAMMAASLHMFAISAPANPGVRADKRSAKNSDVSGKIWQVLVFDFIDRQVRVFGGQAFLKLFRE